MSRTSETQNTLHCSNQTCRKALAKGDGIKCPRCSTITPIHFYPGRAIGGGSIESDWQAHWEEARRTGCHICGIEPEVQTQARPSAGSHGLSAKYMRVPRSLQTTGTDYPLPQFPPADSNWLQGIRVLVISADGPELPEIDVPINYLRERGAQVKVAGQDWIFQYRTPAAHIVLAQWLSDDICMPVDLKLSDVKVEDYDAVFIPGGAWNPDMLRGDDQALRIVREAHTKGLLVATLCHGPQVLINAAFDAPDGQENFPAAGVHITGTGSIRRDLKNAGFIVHNDDATVFDPSANLLSARDPNDLGALCEAMGNLLRKRLPATLD